MDFKPNADANAHETCLKGWVPAEYQELVAAFGKPHNTQLDKGTVRWKFKGQNGSVFTMYDSNLDEMADPPMGVYDWHVGGHSTATDFIKWVTRVLDKQRKAAQHETSN